MNGILLPDQFLPVITTFSSSKEELIVLSSSSFVGSLPVDRMLLPSSTAEFAVAASSNDEDGGTLQFTALTSNRVTSLSK